MSGLTTTTARRQNPVAIGGGIVCAVLGAFVILGYALRLPALVTVAPAFPPMRLVNAVAILSGGLSALLLARRMSVMAAACGALTALIGIDGFVEYLLGVPIRAWETALLKSLHIVLGPAARPGALAGFGFAAAGTALFFMSGVVPFRRRIPVIGLLGSMVACSGGVAFLSYLVGMSSAFSAGQFSMLGVHTSFSLFVMGATIVRYAWRDETSKRTGAPSWLPLLAAACTLTVTLCLRDAIVAEDRAQLDRKIGFDAAYIRSDLETQFENRIQPLIRLARRRSMADEVTRDEWEADVRSTMNRGGYQAIQWVDASERSVWATPPGAGDLLPDGRVAFEARRGEAFQTARETRAVALSRPIDLVTGGKGFIACVPAYINDELQGYAVGVFRYQLLFSAVLNLNVTSKYTLAIYDGQEAIYGAARKTLSQWERDIAVHFHGSDLRIQLVPGDNLLGEASSAVGGAILVAGCLLALLAAVQIWILQTGRPQSDAAQAQRGLGDMQTLVDASIMPVVSYRADGSVQAWNRAAQDLFGAVDIPIRSSTEPFRMLRVTVVRGDGLRGSAIADENTQAMRTLLESSSLPAMAFDSQGVFQSSNRAAAQILGWTEDVWRGRRAGPAATDPRAPFRACCALLIQGQFTVQETAPSADTVETLQSCI